MLGESREDRINHGVLVAVSDDLALINHVATRGVASVRREYRQPRDADMRCVKKA